MPRRAQTRLNFLLLKTFTKRKEEEEKQQQMTYLRITRLKGYVIENQNKHDGKQSSLLSIETGLNSHDFSNNNNNSRGEYLPEKKKARVVFFKSHLFFFLCFLFNFSNPAEDAMNREQKTI